MCEFLSAVTTKDRLFFGCTDSHEDIIDYHGLQESGIRGINIVRLELVPGYFKDPVCEWVFRVDQDLLPDWWNSEKYEKRMRDAVEESGIPKARLEYCNTRDAAYEKYDKAYGNISYKSYNKEREDAFSEYTKIRDAAYVKYLDVREAAVNNT